MLLTVPDDGMTNTTEQKIASVLTIGNVLAVLAPDVDPDKLLLWPPDAFGIVAFLLQKSGAYIEVVRAWPPGQFPKEWTAEMRRAGRQWREACIQRRAPPTEILNWWSHIKLNFNTCLAALSEEVDLVHGLLQVLAASDEACLGIGIPDSEAGKLDNFDNRAWRLLYQTGKINESTVAEHLDRTLFRVLPKMHTPQSGITIRSLSHHLALCTAGEVNPKWVLHPPGSARKNPTGLNLLLLPWPTQVSALDFHPAEGQPGLRNMPENMGFFSYEHNAWTDWLSEQFRNIVEQAVIQVGRIDGVILPELALRSEQEFDQAFAELTSVIKDAFLISGIGGKSPHPPYDANQLGYRVWLAANKDLRLRHTQGKHHRWRLDESQIRQYGITHRLDPYMFWWENTDLAERHVHFFAIAPWLTMSALICEDLARQDPVADVLRAVGPNLVVALLMDGPQLQRRWAARYATVFADDPGSSVLCLTSMGMVNLSNENLPTGEKRERIIGLWKDARGPARQIELKEGYDGVVLALNAEYQQEWSADGRHDEKTTAYLTFGGLHNVKFEM